MSSRLVQSLLSNAQVLGKNGTIYTTSIKFQDCVGDTILFIVNTAGRITVSQQCSFDGVVFYDPVDANGSSLGIVYSDLNATVGVYISFSPALASWTRFKIVEENVEATLVTLKLLFRAEF